MGEGVSGWGGGMGKRWRRGGGSDNPMIFS